MVEAFAHPKLLVKDHYYLYTVYNINIPRFLKINQRTPFFYTFRLLSKKKKHPANDLYTLLLNFYILQDQAQSV